MPGLAAVVILSLAIGIGVNTAVFSWIQALVLRPLPGVADVRSIQLVEPRSETGSYPGASWLEYGDLRARLRAFEDLLAFRMVALNVGDDGRTERVYGLLVSANYFSGLGLGPALGRFLRPDEVARAGAEPVVVISHGLWRARYDAAPDVLGRTIRVNGRNLTIVGVTPDGFQGTVIGLNFSLWMPATLAPALLSGSPELNDRSLRGYTVIGRLLPDATRDEAQAETDAAMRQLAQLYPLTNATLQAEVRPFWRAPRGPQGLLVRALGILQAVLLILLLAVCGNTANLVLARASVRHREVGVRLALGASRWRVVSLLLTESMLMALLGAALGAVFAVWGTEALRAMPLTGALPIRFQTAVDVTGLLVAIVLGLASGLIFGLVPAIQLAQIDPAGALRAGSRTLARPRLRNVLMAAQVALALVVLVAAGLFFRSFRETRDVDPGFRREGLLLAAYDLTSRNLDDEARRTFAARLLQRLRDTPGVEGAAIAASVPLDIHGLPLRSFTLEGRGRTGAAPDQALTNTVTPGYFAAMGIPLRAGRDFVELTDTAAPTQAIVNEAFVRRYLAGAEAIGRRLEAGRRTYTITGVAATSVYDAFGEAPVPSIYFSYRDRPASTGEIHLRTRAGAESRLAQDVSRIVRDLDPALPVYDVRTMAEHIEKNLFLRRIPARMFVVLGPLILLLAAIGIHAVVAYSVSHRTAEIGVRLALGASARRVVAQVVGQTLRVIIAGAFVGWLIALAIDRHLVRGAIDLRIFVGVPALLLLVAAIACWLPARRAASVDPMVALRQE